MSFNLSEWALKNRALVLYAMLLLGAMGAISYANLGQSEDPPFTFKLMTFLDYQAKYVRLPSLFN